MSTISDRIKKIRTEATGKKLSRADFARSLGVTESVVTNWEDAENRLKNGIPEYQVAHISEIYHVNMQWIMTGEGEMMESLDPDALIDKYMPDDSELVKNIMKAFARLPDEEWIRLRNVIEMIKKEGDR